MNRNQHSVEILSLFLLFCVFAGAALLVIAAGANVYRQTADSLENQYHQRTLLSYVSMKIHHYDTFGNVFISDFGDGNAIELEEEIDGKVYHTLIYLDGNSVKELFAKKGARLDPESGIEIASVQSLDLKLIQSGLLRIACVDLNGQKNEVYVHLRGNGEAR